MARTKVFLQNALLVLSSLLLFAGFLEFVIFRFILVASDIPELAFVNSMLKYTPEQVGIHRVKNEIASQFNINRNGWNSKYDEYWVEKPDQVFRVAIIGDSYVEALQVDYDESLAEQLEDAVGNGNLQAYRFGISGAPLSQYLHILRKEALRYSPDMVVIVLVHNDFDESYLPTPGVYTKSFLKLKITCDAVCEEVRPVPYQSPWCGFLRDSATWRYLAYRQQIRFGALRNMILGRGKHENERYQANIDVTDLDKKRFANELVTDYIFRELREICWSNGAGLLIVMDGDRNGIYKNVDEPHSHPRGVLMLNAKVESVADKYNIDFIDLHPIFKKDFAANHKKFSFKCDGHWNRYGHQVVAETIANFIRKTSSMFLATECL